ncbi:hypothetical protein [Jhaorihella thermophila]
MTLFWITFDSHDVLPLAVSIIAALAGFWLARRVVPELSAAWTAANTPDTERLI